MQGIHTYIPETNHVSRVHSVAAIPHVLFMVHIALSAILNSVYRHIVWRSLCVCYERLYQMTKFVKYTKGTNSVQILVSLYIINHAVHHYMNQNNKSGSQLICFI
jgi:hypothetical protein